MARVRRYVDDEDVVDDAEVVHRSVARAPWSPAQAVAIIIGAILAIFGGIVLARTGINFSNVNSHHVQVAGMDHTAILGVIELVVGLFLIGTGAIPGGARGGMTFFGVLMLGFGIVMLIINNSPTTTSTRWFGTDDGTGWLFAITGGILLLTAMLSPVVFGTDRQAVARRSAVVQH
jgi:hypothetical protein